MTKPLRCAANFLLLAFATAPATLPQGTAAQPPAKAPSFEVAAIKLSPAVTTGPTNWMGIRNNPDGIDAQFVTLSMLIQRAYGLRSADQVSGGPQWTRDQRFDVQAKMSETDIAGLPKLSPAENKATRQVMLQALLAEQFKLKVRSETRQAPVFELVAARGGAKLKDAATDANPPLGRGEDGKPLVGFNQATSRTMVAQGISVSALADFLSQPPSGLGRPVIDKTGLTGVYDFTLDWVPHWDRVLPASANAAASPEEADPLFEALRQLGLKLQPATGPIDTIVIDHAEKPTEK